MSKLTRALILAALLAAMNLAGLIPYGGWGVKCLPGLA
jgi:hypothetical protein